MSKVQKRSRSVKRNKKRIKKAKEIYRIKNWSSYNDSLKARGSLSVWFSQEALSAWYYEGPRKRGGKIVYSDLAIETALTLRLIYHLGLRQSEGFLGSIIALMGLDIEAPDYSTLSRRTGDLSIDLGGREPEAPRHVVVDSTGLKVYGEGEWLVRQHGWRKHRRWLKVHLAVEAQNGAILACAVTTNAIPDAEQVPELLEQVDGPMAKVGGDSAYDKWAVYDYLAKPSFQDPPIEPAIAPQKNARIKQHGNTKKPPLPRDQAIRAIRKKGRKKWKQDTGYHRRSLAETAMSRYKRIIDDHVNSKSLKNQEKETKLGCRLLNKMDELGKPASYKVASGI